ncbi:hypothetical protein BC332_06189 [Capsicum chinense]|nr:hypothetical protein BC332_06189 [Capsicum chinense]
MESSRKRRTGFLKGKLMKSLYRGGRAAAPPVKLSPTAASTTNYSSEDDPPSTVYHLHLHQQQQQPKEKLVPFNPNSIITVNQEKAAPPLKPKISYYIPPQSTGPRCVDTDESVDVKAANYISFVQERFSSLERNC